MKLDENILCISGWYNDKINNRIRSNGDYRVFDDYEYDNYWVFIRCSINFLLNEDMNYTVAAPFVVGGFRWLLWFIFCTYNLPS